jgi:DNA-binding IclR family transcriptional regulator
MRAPHPSRKPSQRGNGRGATASTDPNKSATAMRALRVLEVLAAARQALTVAEVAHAIGTPRNTAYRMLITLMEAGYVQRDGTMRGYRLGYKIVSLSRALLGGGDQRERIQECLREISARTGESVHYSVLDRDSTVLVQLAKGTQLVTIDFQIGDRSPLHCTSIGKLLLSFQDPAAIESAIRRGLPKVARNTITAPDRLRAELRKVRAQGYAFDDMELADDMRCVAVPVFGEDGEVAGGISLSGPLSRFTQQRLKELRDCSLEVTQKYSLGAAPA